MTTKAPIERHFACFGLCPICFSCVAASCVAVRRRPSGYAGHAGEAWWTGLPGLTINRRSLAPAPGSAQVAQLVEHATENRSVGGSIPPLGTIYWRTSEPLALLVARRSLNERRLMTIL